LRASAFKKKLYANRPHDPPLPIEMHSTRRRTVAESWDERRIERQVRQLLADKVIGVKMGLWLLVPEHLRLGTWDLVSGWIGSAGQTLAQRLAMQVIHESALCLPGMREQRCLGHTGFELVNGLPFLATDPCIHRLLDGRTIEQSQRLQIALGRIRQTLGHFRGQRLAIDPHRMASYSKRHMRRRKAHANDPASRMAQAFFCLDADTKQPVCTTLPSPGQTVAAGTPPLLDMAAQILPAHQRSLVLADTEHFTLDLLRQIADAGRFDMLVPIPQQPHVRKRLAQIPEDQFTARWAGYATARLPYDPLQTAQPPLTMIVQRCGERPEESTRKAFLCTGQQQEVDALTRDFPLRWRVEDFFNAYQDLGWRRAGTQNLHIRYARMSLALIAQAATDMLRQRMDRSLAHWNASHVAAEILGGLEGDIRVRDDTILVTYYNARMPDHLRAQYEGMPDRLEAEHIDPHVPWLYGLKLDFRFR
jgi:hypothetical protein